MESRESSRSRRVSADIVLAVFALICATAVSYYAYASIVEVEIPKHFLIQSIPRGQSRYTILHDGRCVGKFHTDLQTEPGTVLVAEGTMRFSLGPQAWEATVREGAFFNPLDQLVVSNFKLTSPGLEMTVKTQDPSPIAVHVEATVGGRQLKREMTLPGPIFLRANSDNTYRMDFSAMRDVMQSTLQPLTMLQRGGFPIRVVPAAEAPSTCEDAPLTPENAVPLDRILQEAQQQLGAFILTVPNPPKTGDKLAL